MNIRPAREDEAEVLSALAWASKAHWSYSQQQLEAWRLDLALSAADIANSAVYVIEINGEPAGFYQLLQPGEQWVLEHFWIAPAHMGAGLGRALLSHAASLAGAVGAKAIAIDADPYAEAFYVTCGASTVRRVQAPIPGMPDRARPQMILPLA